jgi:predicted nucleic-acid-binding Zn-ribbon protein
MNSEVQMDRLNGSLTGPYGRPNVPLRKNSIRFDMKSHSLNPRIRFQCPKCGHKQYDVDQVRAVGSFFSKIFNVQDRKFITLICKKCSYTEFYRSRQSKMGNVLDFLAN